VLPPSPSVSPSRLNPNNDTSPKLPPYAASEHAYSRSSPISAEKHQKSQQQLDIASRKESRVDPNMLVPTSPSPPSYRERSTPTPEDIYTRNYI
ncbi:385_t:CDS:1, partial [Dentiscutata heterogama]